MQDFSFHPGSGFPACSAFPLWFCIPYRSRESNQSVVGVCMRIGITCYPTYGGSGVVATELGLELARRGHEIHFISYSQPIRLTGPEPNIHYHEVEVTRYPLFE